MTAFNIQNLSIGTCLALGIATTALTGCSLQDTAGPSDTNMAAVSGRVVGGESPVVGAAVTLWETDPGNTGYPSASNEKAVKLAGPVYTNPAGVFIFNTGYTCQSNEFVYATATGGNPGSGTNNNAVLMAALGSCTNFSNATAQASVDLVINEVSTVAAAYTLGNFMYVDDTNVSTGATQVYIGAPAKNNASSGSCTGTGSAMSCTAAGLSHAFANAANLGSAVSYGSFPTAQAYTTVPGNSLGSVPQAEINTLANILQYCVNSPGGSATGSTSDGSNCGNLFALSNSGGVAPQDTLSALINISKNPRANVGTTCTGTPATSGGIFCLSNGVGAAFVPSLSESPAEWSLAITYTGLTVGGTASSWGNVGATYYPEYLALDANDDVYVLAGNGLTSATSTTSTMAMMTSAGAGQWANASTIDAAQGCYPAVVALDTNGLVWNTYAPSSGKTCTAAILGRSASAGGAATAANTFTSAAPYTIQGQASALAFDRYNNMWYARDTSAGTNIMYRFPYSGNSGAYQNTSTVAYDVELEGASTPSTGVMANVFSIVTDASNNVYASTFSSSVTGAVYVEPNQTPSGVPSYTGQAAAGTAATGTPSYLTTALQTNHSGTIGLDTSGNIYASAASGEWSKIVPTLTSGVITSVAASNLTVAPSSGSSASTPATGQLDSAGTFWFPSTTSSGQIWYSQKITAGTPTVTNDVYTCYAPNGGTTCTNLTYTAGVPGAPSTTTAGPRVLQIDSTGTVWVAAETSGDVIQIFGPGAPLWPQLSYGVFATAPQ